jgi:hypothetical protein
MTTATVDQALALARQLPPRDRARLIALIAHDLAIEPTPAPTATGDPWAALFATMDLVAASPAQLVQALTPPPPPEEEV